MNNDTWKVVKFLLIIGMFGFLYSRPSVIRFVGSLDAFKIVILWYVVWLVFIEILGRTVLGSGNEFHNWSIRYTLASAVIVFVFGVVLYFPLSDYSAIILNHPLDQYSKATEDEILWLFNYDTLGIKTVWLSGILTYVIEPLILMVLAIFMIKPKLFLRKVSGEIKTK